MSAKCKRRTQKGEYGMQITDVRVRKVEKEGKMKAVVSITIDEEFVVHDIKVIEGEDRARLRACLLQCPAAKLLTANTGISHTPLILRPENAFSS